MGAQQLKAVVWIGDTAALSFWRNQGFNICETLKPYEAAGGTYARSVMAVSLP
jgi:ribosomal protein S18 acetylase RimI-like enzyme